MGIASTQSSGRTGITVTVGECLGHRGCFMVGLLANGLSSNPIPATHLLETSPILFVSLSFLICDMGIFTLGMFTHTGAF